MALTEKRLEELFAKHLAKTLSQSEREELFFYATHEKYQWLLRALIADEWEKTDADVCLPAGKTDEILNHILKRPVATTGSHKRRLMKWMGVAASLLLIAGTVWVWQQLSYKSSRETAAISHDAQPGTTGAILTLSDGRKVSLDSAGNAVIADQRGGVNAVLKNGHLQYEASGTSAAPVYNTVSTLNGKQFEMVLPDGSKVWLNSASSITYPLAFNSHSRNVSITGEVYFEVAKKKAATPFVVSCSRQQIMVLGTKFNINSYEDKPGIQTTLLEGKVKVSAGPAEEKILAPGQQSIVAAGKQIQVQPADIDNVMAWQRGFFNFTNLGFAEIMQQLARWYDISVQYNGAVPDIEFEGRMNRNVNLSEILKFFKESGLQYNLKNKELIIY